MRFVVSILAVLFALSVVRAELLVVHLQIDKAKDGGWTYRASEAQEKIATDAELADFLKKLSNKKSGIWLTIESDSDVPIEQLIKILTMVKTNPQGIRVKRIVLGK
jgi:hypothetical protein